MALWRNQILPVIKKKLAIITNSSSISYQVFTMSTIQNFYKDQTIFLTGATGFLGKLILEKLLRTCPDLKKIQILIRPKKNKTQTERLQALLDQPCFSELKKIYPNFIEKIQIVEGDLTLPNLGLSQFALSQVTCIIHSAAIVKFDKDLRTAVNANLRPVKDLLMMAEKMPKLVSFVYVSTAFSHCVRETIEEEFYDVGTDPNDLISLVDGLDDKILYTLTPKLLGDWPNTYVYTKALAEELIHQNKNLSIAIVRPAIVASTCRDPLPGWIDNFQGLVGVVVGVSLGVLRTLLVDPQKKASIVPADHVVNNILASAWHVKKSAKKIYNCTGADSNSNTWGDLVAGLMEFSLKYPLNRTVWYYNFSLTPNKLLHKVKVFFLHTLFAWVIDTIFFAAGKPRIAVKKYRKINKLIDSLSYFTLRSWNFGTSNSEALWHEMDEQDKKIFDFNMENFDWKNYYKNCAIGGRIYLMKDPLETIPKARKRILFLGLIHYSFIVFVLYLFFKILCVIIC